MHCFCVLVVAVLLCFALALGKVKGRKFTYFKCKNLRSHALSNIWISGTRELTYIISQVSEGGRI